MRRERKGTKRSPSGASIKGLLLLFGGRGCSGKLSDWRLRGRAVLTGAYPATVDANTSGKRAETGKLMVECSRWAPGPCYSLAKMGEGSGCLGVLGGRLGCMMHHMTADLTRGQILSSDSQASINLGRKSGEGRVCMPPRGN